MKRLFTEKKVHFLTKNQFKTMEDYLGSNYGERQINRLSLEEHEKQIQEKLDAIFGIPGKREFLLQEATRKMNEAFDRPINEVEEKEYVLELVTKLQTLEKQIEEAKAVAAEYREEINGLKSRVSEVKEIVKNKKKPVNDAVFIIPDNYNKVVALVDPETMTVVGGREATGSDLQRQILE